MKIAWFVHTAVLGGAEFALLESVKGLRQRGIEVTAILPKEGILDAHLKEEGADVVFFESDWWINRQGTKRLRTAIRSGMKLVNQRRIWRSLARLLVQISPDVVVTHTLTVPAAAFAARLAGLPHVWYLHEFFGVKSHDLFFNIGTRPALFLIDHLSERVIVNSRALEEEYGKWIPDRKLRRVHCAVDVPKHFRQIPRSLDAFNLVYTGQLSSFKRQEDAVHATALLASKGLNVRLTLVGAESNAYENFLRQLSNELGIVNSVSFIPFTTERFGYIDAADLALMCSTGESFGRVTIEAMKLRKPVIGANSAGTSELIKDGWNGFLYRAADPADLAAKIEVLYRNRELLRQMGDQACAWANEEFTLNIHTKSLCKVFEEASLRRA